MNKLITFLAVAALACSAFARTFTLKSSELGAQLTNEQFLNQIGFIGENQWP